MPNEKLKFSTFETLDELIRVIDTKAWVALSSLAFLFICGILWLFLGKIPTKIKGTGMLINISGLETVQATVTGRITLINVKIGDKVKKDQPIAFVSQWDLKNDLQTHLQKINEKISINKERDAIRNKERMKYERQLSDLRKELEILKGLEKSGASSEKEVVDMQTTIAQVENKVDDLDIAKMQDENSLSELNRQYENMKNKYEQESVIRAPRDGVVVEISQAVGDHLALGNEIITLENESDHSGKLKAIIYISAFEGKKVQPGMRVLISPSTVKPEEYGSMIGTVNAVSAYPATSMSIMRILHNNEIVKQILGKGSQIEINVDLKQNVNTVSQYQWTSTNGPPIKIQSGTLCDAQIIVQNKHPIELLIPKIKKWANVEGEY